MPTRDEIVRVCDQYCAAVTARDAGSGEVVREFAAVARLDSPVEVEYYRGGGILHTVLRKMAG